MEKDLEGMRSEALAVADAYDKLSTRTIGRPWTTQEIALGFVGDVGDLAKIVMALEGTREIEGVGLAQLEHELCDAIWSCLVIAERYGLNLADAFPRQMSDLLRHIESRMPSDR